MYCPNSGILTGDGSSKLSHLKTSHNNTCIHSILVGGGKTKCSNFMVCLIISMIIQYLIDIFVWFCIFGFVLLLRGAQKLRCHQAKDQERERRKCTIGSVLVSVKCVFIV